MSRHEDKYCPRCNQVFECRLGNILTCQCFGISFTEEEKEYIGKQFNDCLCRNCLEEMKKQFSLTAKQLPL